MKRTIHKQQLALFGNGGGNLERDFSSASRTFEKFLPKSFTNFLFLLLKLDHAMIQCVIFTSVIFVCEDNYMFVVSSG